MSCPSPIDWPRGQSITVEIDWENTGEIEHTFDVLFVVRKPGTDEYYVFAYKSETLKPGESKTTSMATADVPSDWPTGTTDGVAMIVEGFDPETGTVEDIYDQLAVSYTHLTLPTTERV